MSLALRIVLIVGSIALVAFLLHSIKKSKMRIEDAMSWLALSLLIVLLSVFPEIANLLSVMLGFMASVNFIFLFFIFILLLRSFFSNRRISQLENRVKELTQQVAIDRLDHYERMREVDASEMDKSRPK